MGPLFPLMVIVSVAVLLIVNVLDLFAYASSADRSAGDINIPVAVGEQSYSVEGGAPGTGNNMVPKVKAQITGAFVRSETAGMIEAWIAKTVEKNRRYIIAPTLQTDPLRTNTISPLHMPIDVGELIEVAGDNAGAVLDVLGVYISKGTYEAPPSFIPPPLQPGAFLMNGTATFTHIADSFAKGAFVPNDYTLVRDVVYGVEGLKIDSATGCLSRLEFLTGPNIDDHPGVPVSDTSTGFEYAMLYGDFGRFEGQTPPNVETIAVAADAVSNVTMLIRPLGRKVA